MRLARLPILVLVPFLFVAAPVSAQIRPMAIGNVRVTPDGGTPLYVIPSSSGGTSFEVYNNFDTTQEYDLTCSRTGQVASCLVDMETIVLGPHERGNVPVYFTASASTGTGTLTLRADGIAWNTGYYNVTVTPPTPPGVALANYSADTWDRSQCLLAGAGEAAWRCGDLVVSHGLPGFATLGRERSLSLVYTSAQAVPRPVVTAWLTPPLATKWLTGIWVGLKVNGTWRDSARYLPWSTGARQVALAFDASALPTGAYGFELEVRSVYGSASYGGVTAGTLVVVNRAASPFGQGWSVGGVETLVFSQPGGTGTGILWVGGEGSARLYAADTVPNRWIAPAGAYRDTIVRDPGSGEYTRTLRHGIEVVFDASGRHVATVNRVGQRTDFHWTGARLDSVRVPPSVAARPTYRLVYDGAGKLDRITDPAGRVLEATVGAGRLTGLSDPDLKPTTFAYDSAGRMVRRVNRRGFGTRFEYGKELRVTEVRVPIGTGSDSAITTYAPWDEQGLARAFTGQVAVDTGQVATRVFGPRVGVADDATFKVDRWGAPVRITDALGAVTTLLRGSAAVPALVTRVTYPNGRKVELAYDGRGNLTEERVVTAGLPDSQPDLVTSWRYESPNTRDAPDQVTAPGNVVTRFIYTTDGVLDRAIAPNGHVTDFDYVPSGALVGTLRAVKELNVSVWDSVQRREVNKPILAQRFGLNALGNVVADTSPKGRVRTYVRDTVQRVSDSHDPGGHHVSYEYDAVNRLRFVREHLEEIPGSGFSSPLETEYTYGTDLLDSIFDPRNVRRTYRYDAAGRLIAEGDEAGVEETYSLDAGGLVTSAVNRRGATITNAYDLVGRRIKTIWPGVDGFLADSLRLTYDAMGQLTRAEAEGRAVARSWYPTGAIKRDSSNLVVEYAYDDAGRREWYRTGLSTAVNRDSVVYRYDPVTGALATIAVRWWGQTDISDSVQFRWDSLGRRDTLLYSNGARALHIYDEDGALRVLCGSHPNPPTAPQPSVFNFAVVHTWVDEEGQIRRTDTGQPGIGGCGATYFTYLDADQSNTYDARHQLRRQVMGAHDWTYAYDGSGNRVEHVQNGERWTYAFPAGSNRIEEKRHDAGTQCVFGSHWCYELGGWYEYTHLPDGSRATETPCETAGCTTEDFGYREYRYDALGRTRETEETQCLLWRPSNQLCEDIGGAVVSSCIYDPLQRLVGTCENAGPWLGYDGDRVVRTDPQSTSYFWTFVHAEGVDDPVLGRYTQNQGFGQTYFFVTDGQGRQYAVGRADGWDGRVEENYTLRGGRLSGAGEIATSFGVQRLPSTSQPGLAFFRNRFYDQQTGRWTQEDPIGVAGGVNLYGFVGNNPVMFSDPFGLCPEVIADGKNVQINAHLVIEGGEPADATAVRNGIMSNWNRKIGGYSVTVNLDDASAPTIAVHIQGRVPRGGRLEGRGGSYGPGGGGEIFLPSTRERGKLGLLAGHEFGHTLGNMGPAASPLNLMYEDKIGGRGIQGNGLGADQIKWAIEKCKVESPDSTQSAGGTEGKTDGK